MTYNQHLKGKKHKENKEKFLNRQKLAKMKAGIDEDCEDVNLGVDVNIDGTNFKKPNKTGERLTTLDSINVCLFSDHKSDSFQENLDYMFRHYGFLILEEKSCIDKEGLIKYLANLIHEDHKCIFDRNFHFS